MPPILIVTRYTCISTKATTPHETLLLLPHNNIQRPPPNLHAMLQRAQLGHHRHQTRILTLDPHLLPDLDLLAPIPKYHIRLVVLGSFGCQAEPFAEIEAAEGVGGCGA